jgi:tellurium resistance protein TerZ
MGINLVKGQKIDLRKSSEETLTRFCVGVNWGAIEKKGWFGGISKEAVDLDASCALYDNNKNLLDIIYFGKLQSNDNSIQHSGDDLTGDMDGDDGLDNEIITVDLNKLNPEVSNIAFVLNSFKGQDFGSIPFASIRIYEGTPTRVNEVFATFDIANGSGFAGHVSMIMGLFYKKDNQWKFNAIGEPTKDKKLQDTINTLTNKYL